MKDTKIVLNLLEITSLEHLIKQLKGIKVFLTGSKNDKIKIELFKYIKRLENRLKEKNET